MKTLLGRARGRARALHREEDGLQTLEVVMILAVAAVILSVIVVGFPTIRGWFVKQTNNVLQANGADYTPSSGGSIGLTPQ